MRFSIIIPVYNAEKYLRAALDSVLAQTYADWECICVDDGSIDGSGAILDYYAAKDSRFKVVHKKNEGVAIARNVGLDNATGEFVTWLDADDMYAPWRLEEADRLFIEYQLDLVRFNTIYSEKGDEYFDGIRDDRIEMFVGENARRWGWSVLMLGAMMWTFVAKRELFNGNRFLPNIRIKEEATVAANIANRIKCVAQSEAFVYYYRQVPGSAMHTARRVQDSLNLMNALKPFVKDANASYIKERLRMHIECEVLDWVRTQVGEENRLTELYAEYLELRKIGLLKCKSIQQWRYRLPMWWFDKTGQVWMIRMVDKVIKAMRLFKTGLTRLTGLLVSWREK